MGHLFIVLDAVREEKMQVLRSAKDENVVG
jgi:hypothetical protein